MNEPAKERHLDADSTQSLKNSLLSSGGKGDFSTLDTGSVPRHSSEPVVPVTIGRYRIERVLGKGGFGIVYLAYDDQLERHVAIKVANPARPMSSVESAAYLSEARYVASLDHPSIVPVHDVGATSEVQFYVVSKFIEGHPLSERIQESRPSPVDSARLVAAVAYALHYAHGKGLVHRDIKPGNILIDVQDRPFVVDFGLALKEEDMGSGPGFYGTPAYMSPEQAKGDGNRVDGRSDIFSLGVVFYELLVGRRPFRGTTVAELLHQICTLDPRPPRQIDDRIPRELERICLKSLAKNTAERYSTAKDLADELQSFLDQRPVSVSNSEERIAEHQEIPERLEKHSDKRRRSVTARAFIFSLAAVAAVTAIGIASYVKFYSAVSPPLGIKSLAVNHFATLDSKTVQPRGEFGRQSFSADQGDEFTVVAHLSKPAYCFLAVFRPDGKSQVLYPQDDTDKPALLSVVGYPSKRRDERYVLEEGSGLWVVVLIASESPLPSYREWTSLHSDIPWHPSEGLQDVVLWDDGQLLHTLMVSGDNRGSRKETRISPLVEIVDWLRMHVDGEINAVGFTVE